MSMDRSMIDLNLSRKHRMFAKHYNNELANVKLIPSVQ